MRRKDRHRLHVRCPEQEVAQDLERVRTGETGQGETHQVAVSDGIASLDAKQLSDSTVVGELEGERSPGDERESLLSEEFFQVSGETISPDGAQERVADLVDPVQLQFWTAVVGVSVGVLEMDE